MRAIFAALIVAVGCGSPPAQPRDAGPPSIDAAARLDAGPPWAAAGCEPIAECLSYSGVVAYCPSVHDAFGGTGMERLADCERWLRCPRTGEAPCYSCRDWSASATRIVEPETTTEQPACSRELCPVPDGGVTPMCHDGGP